MNGTPRSVYAFAVFSVLLECGTLAQAPRAIAASPGLPPATARAEPRAEVRAEPLPGIRSEFSQTPTTGNATPGSFINSAAGDYVLSSSDTLEMSIFGEPALATRSRIASDGTVLLPLLGDIKVSGLSVRAARELIRKLYDAEYLVNPQVSLNLVDFAQRKFTILGQIQKPGPYEIPGGRTLSLLEAVGMAGGFTRSADKGKVIIRRTAEGGTQGTIKVNAKKMAAGGKETFDILPGDVISVGESWF